MEYSDVVPAGGVRILESEGASEALLQGWAELVSSRPLNGTTIFRQRNQNGIDSEGAVPIPLATATRVVLPFDNAEGFVTSLALLNESVSSPVTLSIMLRDESGQTISMESYLLEPLSRSAFALPEQFLTTQGRRGTAEMSGSSFSLFGLRFNPRGSFTSVSGMSK
jgi:hypothetical protein